MKSLLLALLVIPHSLSALTIKIDYTYDTNNFFNTPVKRAAIESVAKFYGDLIKDNLKRIDPADFPSSSWEAFFINPQGGADLKIPNLIVPEDTIIIFVGAQNFGGNTLGYAGPGYLSYIGFSSWTTRVLTRGNSGVLATPTTDFAPWGGAISFSSVGPWNFSQSQNLANYEFIQVALHEMGHVLGIGTADSWRAKISAGTFIGPAVVRSYGSAPAVQSNGGHFDQSIVSSRSFGSFQRTHGAIEPVSMIPSLFDDGSNFDVTSDLDLAALVDIGWQIRPKAELTFASLSPLTAAFSWKSSSFINYKIQRSSDLISFPGGSAAIVGNAQIQTWNDSAPLAGKAFYRLAATPAFTAPPTTSAPAQTLANRATATTAAVQAVVTGYQPPVVIPDCGCTNHR